MTIAFRPLRNPNPLGFPGGVLPGVDWSHPAAPNVLVSAVAMGGNVVSLRSGSAGTPNGSPTSGTDGKIGPVVKFLGNSNVTLPLSGSSLSKGTIAAIFNAASSTGSPQYALNNAAAGSMGLGYNIGAGTVLGWLLGNVAAGTTVTPVFGAPYFFAVTFSSGGVLGTWVICRLDTGLIASGSVASASGGAGDGNLYFGNRGTNTRQLNGSLGAGMVSSNFLTGPQMLAWAADPWAFWYPRGDTMLVGAAAAAFKAYWAQQNNLPVIGAGTY